MPPWLHRCRILGHFEPSGELQSQRAGRDITADAKRANALQNRHSSIPHPSENPKYRVVPCASVEKRARHAQRGVNVLCKVQMVGQGTWTTEITPIYAPSSKRAHAHLASRTSFIDLHLPRACSLICVLRLRHRTTQAHKTYILRLFSMSVVPGSTTEGQDSDFWEFVACGRCHLPFTPEPGAQPTIPFWITECGHVVCNNHLSRIYASLRVPIITDKSFQSPIRLAQSAGRRT